MAKLNFKASELPVDEKDGDFAPLPAGWYSANIIESELKDTNSGTGQYIKIRYDITGPTHQGRVVFGMLNNKNDNEVAEKIGLQQLGTLMKAVKLEDLEDTDQFVGANLDIKLKIKPARGEYGESNDVCGYRAGAVVAGIPGIPKPDVPGTAPWGSK